MLSMRSLKPADDAFDMAKGSYGTYYINHTVRPIGGLMDISHYVKLFSRITFTKLHISIVREAALI